MMVEHVVHIYYLPKNLSAFEKNFDKNMRREENKKVVAVVVKEYIT